MYALLQGARVEGLQSRMKERRRIRKDQSAPKEKVAKKEEKQKGQLLDVIPQMCQLVRINIHLNVTNMGLETLHTKFPSSAQHHLSGQDTARVQQLMEV